MKTTVMPEVNRYGPCLSRPANAATITFLAAVPRTSRGFGVTPRRAAADVGADPAAVEAVEAALRRPDLEAVGALGPATLQKHLAEQGGVEDLVRLGQHADGRRRLRHGCRADRRKGKPRQKLSSVHGSSLPDTSLAKTATMLLPIQLGKKARRIAD